MTSIRAAGTEGCAGVFAVAIRIRLMFRKPSAGLRELCIKGCGKSAADAGKLLENVRCIYK